MIVPRGPKPAALTLTPAEREGLEALIRRPSTPQQLVLRSRIVLAGAAGRNNAQIARELAVGIDAARRWRRRWQETAPPDPAAPPPISARLQDLPRPGSPGHFTAEQFCQLVAMGCETPAGSQRPISHWTPREIAAEAKNRGIVARISPRHVSRLYKRGISSRI
jgi:putative transposase